MGKRSGRQKHIPRRTCIACRTVHPKRMLIRIVRTPEGEVVIDPTGKRSGRGAYLCAKRSCWELALQKDRLGRALRKQLTSEIKARLREYADDLPQDETLDGSATE